MASVLIIVDRPFRGVLERQFADAVHLARVAVLQFGAVSILLTGEGVLLTAAAAGQGLGTSEATEVSERTATPEGTDVGHPDDGDVPGALAGARSLLVAADSGVPVLVDATAAAAYGVTAALAGRFEMAPPERTLDALVTHDHVWYA
jgi:hypothetical protein